MGVSSPSGIYDCNGRLAAGRTYVYLFMARDGDGPMYVKCGRSDNPVMRVGQVQTGCPFPIVKAGMVKCLSLDQAKSIEQQLHELLGRWASSGEWFRFDWSDLEQRTGLHAAMQLAFAAIPEWTFEEIDLEHAAATLRALATQRKRSSRANKRDRRA